MDISPENSGTMTFLWQEAATWQIFADNKRLLQVKNLKYLSCDISYETEKDIQQKLSKFAQELGNINSSFKPNFSQKFSTIKVHNAMVLPIIGTAVAQWLRRCATNRKVAGSIPDGVIGIFHWYNPSDRTMVLGSTQPLTEMSTRRISWG